MLEKVIPRGAKASTCQYRVGRESEKNPQGTWGSPSITALAVFLKLTCIEWLLCTGHFVRLTLLNSSSIL